jgi:hypothetical protein
MKQLALLGTVSLSLLLGAHDAGAASQADLAVGLSAPAGIRVDESGGYTVSVANTGRRNAAGVRLTIALPVTNTSPNVYLMGALGAYDPRCTRSGATLTCNLGTIARGASTSVAFDLALPHAMAPLTITASATTTTLPEPSLANNTASVAVAPAPWAAAPIDGPAAIETQVCTGTGLSSFFECEQYPGSISAFDATLEDGGAITVDGMPDVTGQWSLGNDVLHLEYADSYGPLGSIDAVSVGGGCFEGRFDDGGAYTILHQICVVP